MRIFGPILLPFLAVRFVLKIALGRFPIDLLPSKLLVIKPSNFKHQCSNNPIVGACKNELDKNACRKEPTTFPVLAGWSCHRSDLILLWCSASLHVFLHVQVRSHSSHTTDAHASPDSPDSRHNFRLVARVFNHMGQRTYPLFCKYGCDVWLLLDLVLVLSEVYRVDCFHGSYRTELRHASYLLLVDSSESG